MSSAWTFADPRNLAVITSRSVLDGHEPITYVGHDEVDGGWQFIGPSGAVMADAVVVALQTIVRHDQSIADLADLPIGWKAERVAQDQPWTRAPHDRSG